MTIDKHDRVHAIKNREVVRDKNNYNSTKLLETTQIANSEQDDRDCSFNYLRYGVFWGCIFTLNALVSACLGAALTTIKPVNHRVKQLVGDNWAVVFNRQTPELARIIQAHPLTRPINILLVEIRPTKPTPKEFPGAFVGKSSNILLLQLRPDTKVAKLVTIPLDSKVRIPGLGWNTIVNANRYGGLPLVSRTVSQMNKGVKIDRYIRATPNTFSNLTASLGKLEVSKCSSQAQDCSDNLLSLRKQKATLTSLAESFKNPERVIDVAQAIETWQGDIDTNLSSDEAIAVASFLGQLDSQQISVSKPVSYTKYRRETSIGGDKLASDNSSRYLSFNSVTGTIDSDLLTQSVVNKYSHPFHHARIAVQNTTDRPELGMRVVSYLIKNNFQNVSLVEHIPLKLENTEIVLSAGNLRTGNYLQQVLNLGNLKLADQNSDRDLVIRLGDDAQSITIENGFLR